MYNYFATIRNWIVFTGCFLLLFSGCESQTDTPESKKVISKKIVVSETDAPKAPVPEKSDAPEQTLQEKMADGAPVAPDKDMAPSEAEPVVPGKAEEPPPAAAEKSAEQAPESPAIAQQDEPAAGGPGPSLPIPQKTGDVAYVYDPTGKIDPFAPIFREKAESGIVSEKKNGRPERKPMTPLEKIALSQLKLVAVMVAPSGNRALVEEASGKGYIINEGTFIGTNSGRVMDILLDRVVVEEEVEDVMGNLTLKKTEMKLQKAPGE